MWEKPLQFKAGRLGGQWFLCEILFCSYTGHTSVYWVILFNVFLSVSQSWLSNPECPANMITQDVYSLTEKRESQSGRRLRVWESGCIYQKKVQKHIENSSPVLERHSQITKYRLIRMGKEASSVAQKRNKCHIGQQEPKLPGRNNAE